MPSAPTDQQMAAALHAGDSAMDEASTSDPPIKTEPGTEIVSYECYCGECGQPSTSLTALDKHFDKYHFGKYSCSFPGCSRCWSTRYSLQMHLRKSHPRWSAPTVVTGHLLCQNIRCGVLSADVREAAAHSRLVHGWIPQGPPKRPFRCADCATTCVSVGKIERHRRKFHPQTEQVNIDDFEEEQECLIESARVHQAATAATAAAQGVGISSNEQPIEVPETGQIVVSVLADEDLPAPPPSLAIAADTLTAPVPPSQKMTIDFIGATVAEGESPPQVNPMSSQEYLEESVPERQLLDAALVTLGFQQLISMDVVTELWASFLTQQQRNCIFEELVRIEQNPDHHRAGLDLNSSTLNLVLNAWLDVRILASDAPFCLQAKSWTARTTVETVLRHCWCMENVIRDWLAQPQSQWKSNRNVYPNILRELPPSRPKPYALLEELFTDMLLRVKCRKIHPEGAELDNITVLKQMRGYALDLKKILETWVPEKAREKEAWRALVGQL